MIISEALLEAKGFLRDASASRAAYGRTHGRRLETPIRRETEILLCHAVKKSKEFLIAHPDFSLPEVEVKKFRALYKKRATGIPLAYALNHKEFFGLDFYVDENVLIPRPETELLVEKVIELATSESLCDTKNLRILDLGTGSGCIAISLAKRLPEATITASDISKKALAVARKNARTHDVARRSIKCVHGTLLEPFKKNPFDIIVANLPYIPTTEKNLVEEQVKNFEPKEALWAGKDGLLYIKEFLQQLAALSWKPRFIVAEFGFSMKPSMNQLIKKTFPHAETIFLKDLAGRDRMVTICLKN